MMLIKETDWKRIACKYYEHLTDIEFKCPNCNHIQSVNSILKNNKELSKYEVRDFVSSNCEGRYTKGYGCDWSLQGLLKLHTLEILTSDGSQYSVFNYANREAMEECEKISIKNPYEKNSKLLEVGTLWKCKTEFIPKQSEVSRHKLRKIKIGEILEFRYFDNINFRTINNEYFYLNKGKFLTVCDYYGKILSNTQFENKLQLKEILEKKLFEKMVKEE